MFWEKSIKCKVTLNYGRSWDQTSVQPIEHLSAKFAKTKNLLFQLIKFANTDSLLLKDSLQFLFPFKQEI